MGVEGGLLYAAYDRLPTSLLLSVLAAIGFGLLLSTSFPAVPMTVWVAAVIACTVLRAASWVAFRRASPASTELRLWRALFFAGVLAASAAWTVAPTLMIANATGAQAAFLIGTLLIICAVAASSLAPQQAAMHTFFVLTLLPPAMAICNAPLGGIERYLSAMIIGGMSCMMISGRRASQAMHATLQVQQQLRAAIKEVVDSRVALEESEQRYRAMAEWSPDPIAVHRDGKLVYLNPAGVMLSGAQSAQQLIGKPVLDLVHPDSRLIIEERLKAAAAGSVNSQRTEVKFVRPDGAVVDAEIQGTSIIYDGAPAVHVAIRDITERKRTEAARQSLEAQLREAQKMQAIGTLAGGIAHDFNNIIATILGNAELARQDMHAPPGAVKSIDEIRKAGVRARDLVQQILSFSRRQPNEHKPVSLCAIVEESVRLLRITLPARVVLKVHCDAHLPRVSADATQIQQVVINLCTNASQAMQGRSGEIMVRVQFLIPDSALQDKHSGLRAFCEQHPDRAVCLSVSDNGCGMDAATLARIFEPFFTTKPVDEGTGLGLSVVHGIVQAHKGVITVESEPGVGTCFALYLAALEAEPVEPVGTSRNHIAVADAADAKSARSGHILYIDDDESLVLMVRRLMERRGYRVSGFSNQQTALSALSAAPTTFDVVITDYNMPGMSGLDVAREVHAIRSDLRVAVVSGFIDETLRAQVGAAGVYALIFKAMAVEDLCEEFERLVQTVEHSS